MHQLKICLWECTQQQLRCNTPKPKRRRCDETTITGCTGSYHFDNLQCGQWRKSKKLSLLCMSDMETWSCRITPCQCSLLRLLLQWSMRYHIMLDRVTPGLDCIDLDCITHWNAIESMLKKKLKWTNHIWYFERGPLLLLINVMQYCTSFAVVKLEMIFFCKRSLG